MDKAQVERFLNQLVTVTLKDGVVLTGELIEMPTRSLGFAVRSDGNINRVFDLADVTSLERAHPAEEKFHAADCTCSHTDDLARVTDDWMRCPLHGPTVEPIVSYEEFCSVFFAALPELARGVDLGKCLDGEGEYEHAAFAVAADYKPAGEEHVIQVVVTSKSGPNRRKTLLKSWKTDDPAAVAQEAIETLRLLT